MSSMRTELLVCLITQQPFRSYNRTWEEIEAMLENAEDRLTQSGKIGMNSVERMETWMV